MMKAVEKLMKLVEIVMKLVVKLMKLVEQLLKLAENQKLMNFETLKYEVHCAQVVRKPNSNVMCKFCLVIFKKQGCWSML